MFELVINAAKFALSDDVRKSSAAILDLIKRSPEWERDICTLEAKIARIYAEQAALLSHLTESKMVNLGYESVTIDSFKVSYHELVTNAFEHGCKTNRNKIRIIIDITVAYVALTILNPKGRRFFIYENIYNNRSSLSLNPAQPRGRGLLIVSKNADSLEQIQKYEGVKAVFYKERVTLEAVTMGDLMIIEIQGGAHNPSFKRRIANTAADPSVRTVIVDFSLLHRLMPAAPSDEYRVILDLSELYLRENKQVLALFPPGEDRVMLPDSVVASSWDEALKKVSRLDLLSKVKRLIQTKRRDTNK